MARVLYAERADSAKPVLDIALSERNLLVLLTKLYTPGSACTIQSGDVPDEFGYAQIRVEPDEYHYEFPTRDGAAAGRNASLLRGRCCRSQDGSPEGHQPSD